MNCFGLNIVQQIHWISVLYVSPYRHTVGNVWAVREYVVIFDSRYNNTAVVSDIFVLTLLVWFPTSTRIYFYSPSKRFNMLFRQLCSFYKADLFINREQIFGSFRKQSDVVLWTPVMIQTWSEGVVDDVSCCAVQCQKCSSVNKQTKKTP